MRHKINPRSRFSPTPHCLALRDQLQHTLLNAALKSVMVIDTPEHRDVIALERMLCRRCETSQTITLWFCNAEGHWRRCPAGIRFNPFSPFDSQWLRWWLQGEHQIIATGVTHSVTFAQLIDWLCDVLASFIRCKQAQLGGRSITAFLNEQTVACLGLNEAFWQRYRVRGQTSNHHDADEKFVHHLWRARACLEQVEKENKGLTTFVLQAIVGGFVEPSANILRDLKRFFLTLDVKRSGDRWAVVADTPFDSRDAMWRLLCRHADELYAELQLVTDFKWGEVYFWLGVVAHCDCYVRAQTFPPLWARDVLVRRHISLGDYDRRVILSEIDIPMPLADHVLRSWLQAVKRARDVAQHCELHRELALVSRWWKDKQPTLDREQRRGGWCWLIKQAQRWQHYQQLNEQAARPVPCPLPIFTQHTLTARALLTALDVGLEGDWMRHCVGLFWSEIEVGTYLVYRVSEASRPLATIGLKREKDNRWSVHDTRLRFNVQADQRITEFAHALAMQLTQLSVQGAFPLPPSKTDSTPTSAAETEDEPSIEDLIESFITQLRSKG